MWTSCCCKFICAFFTADVLTSHGKKKKKKAQVWLITPVNNASLRLNRPRKPCQRASMWAAWGPEAGRPQWKDATINVISYTCAAPAIMWEGEKKKGPVGDETKHHSHFKIHLKLTRSVYRSCASRGKCTCCVTSITKCCHTKELVLCHYTTISK